jgi:hypothetical protein
MTKKLLVLYILALIGVSQSRAQDSQVDFSIRPQPTPQLKTTYRLLPDDSEVVEGNAVVVLLRLPYDENPYVDKIRKDLKQLLEMDIDDPELKKLFSRYPFERGIKRAAKMRQATWEYDTTNKPIHNVFLPDVNNLRLWLGHVYSLRIGQQINRGDFDGALENLQAQFACSRHIARTPFLVSQSIANANYKMALINLEFWSKQTNAPNLYWALEMLPDDLLDLRESWDWQSAMLYSAMPSLEVKDMPEVGSPVWDKIFDEFSQYMADLMQEPLGENQAKALHKKMFEQSKIELTSKYGYNSDEIGKMLPQEMIMRWILKEVGQVDSDIVAYVSTNPQRAMPKLVEIAQKIDQRKQEFGVSTTPFIELAVNFYLMPYHFNRWVKQLQAVESIRDYLAKHDNQLPSSLEQLDLPVSIDPLTGLPFEYVLEGEKAILRTPIMNGFEEQTKALYREYAITVAK